MIIGKCLYKTGCVTVKKRMYCRNCGVLIDEHAAVCLRCGVKSGTGSAYCPNCGNATGKESEICTRCGTVLPCGKETGRRKPVRSKILALGLAIIGGMFGLHNFYMGHIKNGAVQLFLTSYVVARLKSGNAALALASNNEAVSLNFMSLSLGVPLAPAFRAAAANASPFSGGWFAAVIIMIVSLAVRVWSLIEGVNAYQGKLLDAEGNRLR